MVLFKSLRNFHSRIWISASLRMVCPDWAEDHAMRPLSVGTGVLTTSRLVNEPVQPSCLRADLASDSVMRTRSGAVMSMPLETWRVMVSPALAFDVSGMESTVPSGLVESPIWI